MDDTTVDGQELAYQSALRHEVYSVMPDGNKRRLHEWEREHLPLGKQSSEWPGWPYMIDQMSAYRIGQAKKNAGLT